MILTALYELTQQEGLVPRPHYEPQRVSFLIKLGPGGELLGIEPTKQTPASSKGKTVARWFQVPKHSGRTSGDKAEFLCDKAEYVFGVGDRQLKKLKNRQDLFRQEIEKAAAATGDAGLQAVHSFLQAVFTGVVDVKLPNDLAPDDLFAFVYVTDMDVLVSDRPAVVSYWTALRGAGQHVEPSCRGYQCLVTGQRCAQVDKHPVIKKVPGGTSSGVALVSINPSSTAFQSYRLSGNENAPVSQAAADGYTTALNRLLDSSYPDPITGSPMPRRHVRLTPNTAVLYWAREQVEEVDLLTSAFEADPEAVEALYGATWKGRMPALTEPSSFYALTLSGSQGRAVLRDWFESTVGQVLSNVRQHFDDTAIVRPRGESGGFPLGELLRSTALLGKDENLAPGLAADLFRAVLRGWGYPRVILDAAIRRMRAERAVTPARAALIKAYLVRTRRMRPEKGIPEVTMGLNKESSSTPYQLGRLFAALEKLQEEANKPSATIRDRFFGRASANPVTVFPTLMRGAMHHYPKVRRRVFFEKLVQEIVAGIDRFPSTLSLEEQGMFAIGYYHERQDLFTTNAEAGTEIAQGKGRS